MKARVTLGFVQDPEAAKARDERKAQYRDYLLRRLRVPAGVVFGHGLVDLALIQGSEEVDSAVMQRLQANSLAELEHLFLEFYQELMLVRAWQYLTFGAHRTSLLRALWTMPFFATKTTLPQHLEERTQAEAMILWAETGGSQLVECN